MEKQKTTKKELTQKQKNTWLKVEMKKIEKKINERSCFENKDRIFNLYSKFSDKIFNK